MINGVAGELQKSRRKLGWLAEGGWERLKNNNHNPPPQKKTTTNNKKLKKLEKIEDHTKNFNRLN